MELLAQKVVVDNLTVEITVHDLSYRMGFPEGVIPKNHLYVSLTARDHLKRRIWTTPLLTDDGKIKPFSSISEALFDAKLRIGARPDVDLMV